MNRSSRRKDLTGLIFGRLQVIDFSHVQNKQCYWRCVCECSSFIVVKSRSLVRGSTRSCGCLRREFISKLRTTHNKSNTIEYKKWKNMRMRCKRDPYYLNAGISVCEEWNSFEKFISDMGIMGEHNLTIDRIDNSKGYCKENCRWASWKQQANNSSKNHVITTLGKTLTLAQWQDETGISQKTIINRIRRGWDFESAVSKPVRNKSESKLR